MGEDDEESSALTGGDDASHGDSAVGGDMDGNEAPDAPVGSDGETDMSSAQGEDEQGRGAMDLSLGDELGSEDLVQSVTQEELQVSEVADEESITGTDEKRPGIDTQSDGAEINEEPHNSGADAQQLDDGGDTEESELEDDGED